MKTLALISAGMCAGVSLYKISEYLVPKAYTFTSQTVQKLNANIDQQQQATRCMLCLETVEIPVTFDVKEAFGCDCNYPSGLCLKCSERFFGIEDTMPNCLMCNTSMSDSFLERLSYTDFALPHNLAMMNMIDAMRITRKPSCGCLSVQMTQQELLRHFRTDCANRMVTCQFKDCGFKSTPDVIAEHERSCSRGTNECPVCNQRFSLPFAWNAHKEACGIYCRCCNTNMSKDDFDRHKAEIHRRHSLITIQDERLLEEQEAERRVNDFRMSNVID